METCSLVTGKPVRARCNEKIPIDTIFIYKVINQQYLDKRKGHWSSVQTQKQHWNLVMPQYEKFVS